MIDQVLTVGISNLCLALGIATIAWLVQSKLKRPGLAHLLWLFVLAKLLTPALFTLPVVALPEALLSASAELSSEPILGAIDDSLHTEFASNELQHSPQAGTIATPWLDLAKRAAVALWIAGSLLTLAWTLLRIDRFNKLLHMGSHAAPPELQAKFDRLVHSFALKKTPELRLSSAHLSPMLWWVGGRVRIFLPAALQTSMDAQELRYVLAHELAHVKRRDHLVRWVEWLACVALWWNPLTWMARRNLRMNEELCCDALVLSTLRSNPRQYANSLINVLEFLATPGLRPPAMASRLDSGGHIEKRIKMIISKNAWRNTPSWLNATFMSFALCLMPLGVAYAQDPDYDAVSTRLVKAVKAGELNEQQAKAMFGALAEESLGQRLEQAEQRSKSKPKQKDKPKRTAQPGNSAERIQAAFNKLGVQAESLARIKKRLVESGFKKEQLEGSLGALLRILYAQQESSAVDKVDPRMAEYFKKLKLNIDQIKLIHGLARRLSKSKQAPPQELPTKYLQIREKVRAAVEAGKLSAAQGQSKLDALRKEMNLPKRRTQAPAESDHDQPMLPRRRSLLPTDAAQPWRGGTPSRNEARSQESRLRLPKRTQPSSEEDAWHQTQEQALPRRQSLEYLRRAKDSLSDAREQYRRQLEALEQHEGKASLPREQSAERLSRAKLFLDESTQAYKRRLKALGNAESDPRLPPGEYPERIRRSMEGRLSIEDVQKLKLERQEKLRPHEGSTSEER